MAIQNQGFTAGHFIVSESNKTRSREIITVAAGEVLRAGAVLTLDISSQHYIGYQNDETSGGAKAILFDNVDATDGPVKAVAIVRDAEVNGDELQWEATEDSGDRDAAIAELAAVGIICRWETTQTS